MDVLQKRNNTIDLLRFFTCPFILLIHCPLPAPLGDVLIHIGRYGVPFFLLVSGWFSYMPDTQGMVRHARKKLVDTFKLMGSFAVVYLILNSTSAVLRGDGLLSWMRSYTNLASAAYLILFNRALFWGSTGYYVFMLVYVYVLLLIIIRFNLLNKAFFLVPILLSANVLCGAFTNLPWFYYGNFLFTGLPFFYWDIGCTGITTNFRARHLTGFIGLRPEYYFPWLKHI